MDPPTPSSSAWALLILRVPLALPLALLAFLAAFIPLIAVTWTVWSGFTTQLSSQHDGSEPAIDGDGPDPAAEPIAGKPQNPDAQGSRSSPPLSQWLDVHVLASELERSRRN